MTELDIQLDQTPAPSGQGREAELLDAMADLLGDHAEEGLRIVHDLAMLRAGLAIRERLLNPLLDLKDAKTAMALHDQGLFGGDLSDLAERTGIPLKTLQNRQSGMRKVADSRNREC